MFPGTLKYSSYITSALCTNVHCLLKKYFIYLFLEKGERGRKRGRETSLCGCLMRPLLGTQPATQACALTRIEPVTYRFAGQPAFSPLSHTSQGSLPFKAYFSKQQTFPEHLEPVPGIVLGDGSTDRGRRSLRPHADSWRAEPAPGSPGAGHTAGVLQI